MLRGVCSNVESRRIFIFLLLTLFYSLVEAIYGYYSGSIGLLSDSVHMFFDFSALVFGLIASVVSRWPKNEHYRYGYERIEVLSGFVNSALLIVSTVLFMVEAFRRIFYTPEIEHSYLVSVSFIGLVVNLIGIVMFHDLHHHGHHDSNCAHNHEHNHDHHHENNHINNHDCDHHNHDYFPHTHDHSHGRIGINDFFITKSNSEECILNLEDLPSGQNSVSNPAKITKYNNEHVHDFHQINQNEYPTSYDFSPNSLPGGLNIIVEPISDLTLNGSLESMGVEKQTDHFIDDHNNMINQNINNKIVDKYTSHQHTAQHKKSPNYINKGLLLHIIADALGSISVIISSLLVKKYHIMIADPISSLIISFLILYSCYPLLKDTLAVLMQRVPSDLDASIPSTLENIKRIKGVLEIQDFQIWSLGRMKYVSTVRIVIDSYTNASSIHQAINLQLRKLNVTYPTIELMALD